MARVRTAPPRECVPAKTSAGRPCRRSRRRPLTITRRTIESTDAISIPPRRFLDSLLARVARFHAEGMTRAFMRAVQRATDTQDRLLAGLLARSRDCEFGRQHQFDAIRTYDDYRSRVPVQRYEAFERYIDRMRHGELGVLVARGERILMFALTSGTTARPKYIPITTRVLAECRRGWNVWGVKALIDHPGSVLRGIVQVTSPKRDHVSPGGIDCGAITGLLAETQKRLVRRFYTSDPVVSRIRDSVAKYYTIMRFAVPRDVAWLVTANPSTLLILAKTANEHRARLVRDIHDGTINGEFDVPTDIRVALRRRLRPDPDTARRLERICLQHGTLYPKHYWSLKFRAHWLGGTMGLYESQFPQFFGQLPARDIGLIASEGRMSIPVDDHTPAGILSVETQFFEFIPAQRYGEAAPPTLRSHEVEPGGEYFLVLTNASGLYRYDIGDRVRVVGRVGQAPVIEFLSRDAHTASMAGEKLTEDQAVLAMRRVYGGDAGAASTFVLAPRFDDPPRYRLYIESAEARRLANLADRLDRELRAVSVEYAQKRDSLRLGAVEVFELEDGAMASREQRLRRERSRTAEQFKHQYLLPRPGLDEELERAGREAMTLRL